jgi:hypothetical protein
MPRTPFLLALTLGLTLILSAPASLFAADTAAISSLKHRGFTVDYTSLQHRELTDEFEAAMRSQFDMVRSVGVPPATLDFFRQIPIKFVEHFNGTPASYDDGKVEVSIAIIACSERPVLLHEYLHAFHHQRMKGGFQNQDVRMYYEQAKQKNLFRPDSHMMDNPTEYWACSATVYLNGSGQEPSNRKRLERQPDFVEFIRAQFGPKAGSYEGSRNAADLKRLGELQKLYSTPTSAKPSPAAGG